MRLQRLVAGVLALGAGAASAAGGQDWAAAVRADTTLQALVREALERNPAVVERDAALEAARARVRPAGALPDPALDAGVMDLALPGFAFNRSDFTEVDVGLSQGIPWPGTLGARSAVMRAAAAGAQAAARTVRREVIAAVAAAYYRLRYAVTALQTLRHQRELLDAAVQLSTTRYATGTVPQSDPLQAKLARDRLRSEEFALEGERAGALAAVNALRNRPAGEALAAAAIDPALVRAAATPGPPADALVAAALAAHPRLGVRRAAVDEAAQTIGVERLSARPDFTFSARYGYRPVVSGVNLPDFFSAFVAVRLPLWAWRKQHRLADAARADSAATAAGLRDAELQLAREVAETAARVEAARQRLVLLVDAVLPTAGGAVASVLRSYQVGRTEFLTLLAVEDAWYRATLEAAAVAADYQAHLVMLQELTAGESQP